jgi:WD40 repeat protein
LESTVSSKKADDSITQKASLENIIIESKQNAVVEEDDDEDDELKNKKSEKMEQELKLKSSLFTLYSKTVCNHVQYSINLESVLYGHEDWIYTVKFHPRMPYGQPLTLISASMDKTLVTWKYDEENSIWIDQSRVGDIGGIYAFFSIISYFA